MRKPIIAGNWKMNKNIEEAISLIEEMRDELDAIEGVEVVICPPFVSLSAAADLVKGTSIALSAQNMYFKEKGAYTGEISPLMLKDLCQWVILGHSERRKYFGETDALVNRKVKAALAHGLTPIICVGESLEQHEAGQTEEWVIGQIRAALDSLSAKQVRGIVIAYEPIWAIGTGRPATGEGANQIIGLIRRTIAELYNKATAQAIRILYGGSVKPKNVTEFMIQPEIDGALVGGASLRAADFVAIVQETERVKGQRRR